jgi:hypothetical protein
MQLVDLECPNCGRVGTAPREKAHSRLVCRKCHVVFHMSPSGRPVLGEPPVDHREGRGAQGALQTAESKVRKAELNLPEFTSTHGYMVAGIFVAAAAIYGFMTWAGPSDNLSARARTLVEALAHNDLDTVKAAAASGQSDDAVRFYENTRQKLEPLRKLPGGSDLQTSVMVVETSGGSKSGQVVGIFVPSSASVRDSKTASDPMGMTERSVELNLFWVTDMFGRWRLDAKKSLGG